MRRLLFVDDEPHILAGLERQLRVFRGAWDMAFVESGDAALRAIENAPFDVLVTDMRMPGMDGAALLKEVQARSPRTVRIVLTGHAGVEAALRSVCVSHQFLAKPCDPEELRTVVDRACRLQELLGDTALQQVVGNIGELPILPKTYRALVEALGEPEVDLRKVGAIVEQDQGVAAKILQLVNSSYFGVRREITSVVQATTYLGVVTIRDLVLSVEVFRQFEEEGRLPGFSPEREQRHSMLTSRIARKLLDEKRAGEQAFLAGMLHDVGKLILASQLPDRFGRVLEAGAGRSAGFHEVERSLLGVSHAEVGAYLLGLWGMPYPVVEAVAHHHRPRSVADQRGLGVLSAVHVAEALAHEATDGDPTPTSLDVQYLAGLGLTDRLDSWRELARSEAAGGREAA